MEMHSTLPSKRRVKRMTKRQVKKSNLGPYKKAVFRVRFELIAPITGDDCQCTSAFKRSSDWNEGDYLCEWFVDLVEKHHLYCFFTTNPIVENTLKFEAYIESDYFGEKGVNQFIDFARALNAEKKVTEVLVTPLDRFHWKEDNDEIVQKELFWEFPIQKIDFCMEDFKFNSLPRHRDLEKFFQNPKKSPSWNLARHFRQRREFWAALASGDFEAYIRKYPYSLVE